jgi:hypothetical protein
VNNLVEEWNRMRTGQKYFIQYKLELPVFKTYVVTPPLPTVKKVIVNDRVLCSGGAPGEYNNNNNNKLQLGFHPVAVVILHVHK